MIGAEHAPTGKKADIVVEMSRSTDDRGRAIWSAQVRCHGSAYNQSDYEYEPQALLNWMRENTIFCMGRVADEQEGQKHR